MRILYITNVPAPYRVDFFNQLSKECSLTVIYEKSKSDERHSKWKEEQLDTYKTVFLNGLDTGVDSAFSPRIVKYFKKNLYDGVVICGVSSPTQIVSILLCQILRIPYAIEGDGAFVNKKNHLKRIVKQLLFAKAKFCFSTGKYHDEYYNYHKVYKDRVIRYPFSSIHDNDILSEPLTLKEKKYYKHLIGATEEKVIVSVGQFIHRKGFDILLEAATKMDESIGIYIVGGEPTTEYIDFVNNNKIKNVHFVGFKTKAELSFYYKAADIFVLPTREDIWGLVVNEAMAQGLPVVTTKRCAAGQELVKDGYNGFLTDVESSEQIKNAIITILGGSNRRDMECLSLNIIREYTIEKMVKNHIITFKSYFERKEN